MGPKGMREASQSISKQITLGQSPGKEVHEGAFSE